MEAELVRALEAANCFEKVDHIPRDPVMSEFRRRARLQQARWRKAHDFEVGTFRGRKIGSLLAPKPAERDGQNFLSPHINEAVRHRLAHPERHQQINRVRLWTNLLSSMPMCFNVFGELWDAPEAATKALEAWFPGVDGEVDEVRFEWSPGRLDPRYLGNRSAFDVAFLLKMANGKKAAIGIETKYHEHPQKETVPERNRLPHYKQVAEGSNAFKAGWQETILGTKLQQIWLDHLLALSMKQSGEWGKVKFVLVYPSGNVAFAEAAEAYKRVLSDRSTFDARTVEELLNADVLPSQVQAALKERYLW
jgi:hypothetical protein